VTPLELSLESIELRKVQVMLQDQIRELKQENVKLKEQVKALKKKGKEK